MASDAEQMQKFKSERSNEESDLGLRGGEKIHESLDSFETAFLESGDLDCEDCGITFTSAKVYAEHRLKKHGIKREVAEAEKGVTKEVRKEIWNEVKKDVEKVKKEFKKKVAEVKKETPEGERMDFKCDKCPGLLFSSAGSAMKHEAAIHPKNGDRESTRPKTRDTDNFSNAESLKMEEDDDVDSNYGCKLCSRSFAKVGNLNRHIVIAHQSDNAKSRDTLETLKLPNGGEQHNIGRKLWDKIMADKNYDCKFCSKSFTNKGNLKRHRKMDHPVKYEYESQVDLESDVANRTGQEESGRYKCKLCKKAFSQKGNLQRHKKIQHGRGVAEESYQCKVCPYKTSYRQNLKRHNQSAHERKENFASKLTADTERNYITFSSGVISACEDLSTAEPSNSRHDGGKKEVKKREKDGKKFECKLCSKKFDDEEYLKIHNQIRHDDRKDHECQLCTNSFAQASDLKSHHENMHQGKRYRCSLCSKLFSYEKNLTKHNKTNCGTKAQSVFVGSSLDEQLKEQLANGAGQDGGVFVEWKNGSGENGSGENGAESGRILYKCNSCAGTFDSVESFKKHNKLHKSATVSGATYEKNPNPNPCRRTVSYSNLDTMTKYQCPFCSIFCFMDEHLKMHLAAFHDKPKT